MATRIIPAGFEKADAREIFCGFTAADGGRIAVRYADGNIELGEFNYANMVDIDGGRADVRINWDGDTSEDPQCHSLGMCDDADVETATVTAVYLLENDRPGCLRGKILYQELGYAYTPVC